MTVTFELQPTLRGALVELRPLCAADFPGLFAVAADPLVWEQHPESDRHTEEKFRPYFDDAMRSGGALAVVDRETESLIGSTRYHGHDPVRSEIEIGWTFLGRRYWGGRYNGEIKRLMLKHAFRFVDRVVFLIGPHNIRSQRAVEKIGAVRAGSRVADGRESLVFEIGAHDFRRAARAGA